MLISKIIRRLNSLIATLFLRREFGLLGGIVSIIALFSLLQFFSTLLLSSILRDTEISVVDSQKIHDQQVVMEQARSALLMTSDLLNRAGIYFLQDEKVGSVGSWENLAEEAEVSLKKSQENFQAWQKLHPSEATDLAQNYQMFFNGLNEQLAGLQKSSSIDAFFAVPVQAFQSAFNTSYALYQQHNEQLTDASGRGLLQSLSRAQQLFILVSGILLVVAVAVWFTVGRWVIFPLRTLIQHLHVMAAGDLSHALKTQNSKNREVKQLYDSVQEMQLGLQQLVCEVRESSQTLLLNIGQLAEGNNELFQQSFSQEQELAGVVQHINFLASRVQENNQNALQANHRAQETRDMVVGGDRIMQTVNTSMQDIVSRSAEMGSIVSMIETVAFQTNILALNAAIEAAHAGHQGRGFAVVAREVGLLAQQSSDSTQKIQSLISHSLQGIENGNNAVTELELQLKNVITEVVRLSSLLSDISTASADQDSSVSHVTDRIETLNNAVSKTGMLIKASTETSQRLLNESQRLEKAVTRFQMAS